MPATLCKVMYFSAVMKVPSSWGSCTSRSHPHFSHASDIHWAGSELVVMPASFQNPVERPTPPGEALAVVADAHAQEKGPDRMAGPLRRDKPVLIPMYAEIVGYARCSTDAKDLTAQIDALTRLGVDTQRIYVDHGLTGTTRARPGLREALAAVRAGDELVVTKLDRLARSVPDARAIAEELTARGVKLNLGGSVHDPTDPIGKLLFTALSMVAEFEADLARLSEPGRAWPWPRPRAGCVARSPNSAPPRKPTCLSCTAPAATPPPPNSPSCSPWPAPPSTAPSTAPEGSSTRPANGERYAIYR
jgi:hypothetical protein